MTQDEMSQTPTPPLVRSLEQLEDLRERVLAGEEVSREELASALNFMRQDRMTASATAKKRGGKATVTPLDLASLFVKKPEGT